MGFVQRENEKNLKVPVKKEKNSKLFTFSKILSILQLKPSVQKNLDACFIVFFCEVPFGPNQMLEGHSHDLFSIKIRSGIN